MASLHALPTAKGTAFAQGKESESSQNDSLYDPTALWKFWLQAGGLAWRRCRNQAHRRVSEDRKSSAVRGRSATTNRHPSITCHASSVPSCEKKSQNPLPQK